MRIFDTNMVDFFFHDCLHNDKSHSDGFDDIIIIQWNKVWVDVFILLQHHGNILAFHDGASDEQNVDAQGERTWNASPWILTSCLSNAPSRSPS